MRTINFKRQSLPKILIVDDDRTFRAGLQAILRPYSERVTVVGEASNTDEAIKHAEDLAPDLVLLDLSIPRHNQLGKREPRHGIAVVTGIRRIAVNTRVLILSNFLEGAADNAGVLFDALRAGAHGYMYKGDDFDGRELVDNICRIVSGETIYGPTVAEMMRQNLLRPVNLEPAPGSNIANDIVGSQQILRLRAQGKSVSEIADTLSIDPGQATSALARFIDVLHARFDHER